MVAFSQAIPAGVPSPKFAKIRRTGLPRREASLANTSRECRWVAVLVAEVTHGGAGPVCSGAGAANGDGPAAPAVHSCTLQHASADCDALPAKPAYVATDSGESIFPLSQRSAASMLALVVDATILKAVCRGWGSHES